MTYTTQTKYGKITTLTPMTKEEIEAQCALVSAAADEDPGEACEESFLKETEHAGIRAIVSKETSLSVRKR